MTPQQQRQATAGMLATARVPEATGTPALSEGHTQEKAQPRQQKRQQQQDLCGKDLKVTGNEARNYCCERGSDKKKLVAMVFARSGSESLQRSGNTGIATLKQRETHLWREEMSWRPGREPAQCRQCPHRPALRCATGDG
jgi:hypothetical protein